ncbi:L-aspartate oxidase [Aerophototrophica crusticola]|uniref:L-aspartate oxidase n=1 Tax=Aerophototrophica crusticola TaxID=1709002 RepID=A0A858R9U6_9PROT|nr:L-aspartate oxidase [Rhodospirillaceae bacterium B3]
MDGGVAFRPFGGPVRVEDADVVVVGSGMAGLVAALRLAPRRVTLLTKTADLPGGSSHWAQGGIAAALGAEDSAESHAADTVAAGAGLTDPAVADLLAREGAARLSRWLADGLPADRGADGNVLLGREAAHSAFRILHAGGDATGKTLMAHLSAQVRAAGHVDVRTRAFAWEIVKAGGRVAGLLAHEDGSGWVFIRAATVLLATGGIGQLWRHTTNPGEATADGLALAALAGATLADLEFVQFHPTALATATPGQVPLLTEALRGAGAQLLDARGHRFMPDEHELAELAPRDVVARAIGRRVAAGERVFLDLRAIWAGGGAAKFPTVAGICRDAGIDPAAEPVPVAPAAHYHMGGVVTDMDGRTAVPGLFAAGEVACTGVHGANRLASNSLLEALVFAERAADAILAEGPLRAPDVETPVVPAILRDDRGLGDEARAVLATQAGLVRSGTGLSQAQAALSNLHRRADRLPLAATPCAETVRTAGELRNRLLVSRLIVQAALTRTESRGAHTRTDWPEPRETWLRRQVLTARSLLPAAVAAE